MSATQEIPGSPSAIQGMAAQIEQRERTRALFRSKYETMLHMTEFIVSIQLIDTIDKRQKRELEDLKLMINKTREEL